MPYRADFNAFSEVIMDDGMVIRRLEQPGGGANYTVVGKVSETLHYMTQAGDWREIADEVAQYWKNRAEGKESVAGGSIFNDKYPDDAWLQFNFGSTDEKIVADKICEREARKGSVILTTQTDDGRIAAWIYDEEDPDSEEAFAGIAETEDRAIICLDYGYSLPVAELLGIEDKILLAAINEFLGENHPTESSDQGGV